jgi:large subunit ribosomal protein L28
MAPPKINKLFLSNIGKICYDFSLKSLLELTMSKKCQVTGRRPVSGNSYAIRGIAKKKKGIGLKTTGITRRRFQPNLVTKRFWFNEENRFVTIRLSIAAMRTIDKQGIAPTIRQMRARGITV